MAIAKEVDLLLQYRKEVEICLCLDMKKKMAQDLILTHPGLINACFKLKVAPEFCAEGLWDRLRKKEK